MATPSSIPVEGAHWIADRYQLLGELGRGGMAAVYRAYDRSLDRIVALKQVRLPEAPGAAGHVAELFVQEFHTLAQLAHPRIVEVYDYGTSDEGDYYTMELLGGGDLRGRCPLPWREVCVVLRDVCSALSLLHSRRLVHRDLTPGNIFCSAEGTAKLIDLGAMARVGPCAQIAGTPAFVAPEALNALSVDARTDLFALGATAYYALTGRNAYRARSLASVRDAWRSVPAPPSVYVPDIPPALDSLVMSLLHLTPVARPASAAEVMDRLTAIASIPPDQQLVVGQAYLTTPQLVGREQAQLRFRKQVMRAARGNGGTTLVTGQPGVGRSRFLEACVLEGKLLGAVVLRAAASDSATAWGAACALGRQLCEALPDAVARMPGPRARVLAEVMPELSPAPVDATDRPRFEGPQDRRARISEAFRDWLVDVSDARCLILVVDDLDRLDEASASLVAWIAGLAGGRRLCVLASAREQNALAATGAAVAAVARVRESGARVRLRNLGEQDAERLLGSVFGDVPSLRVLARRIFEVAHGNPGATMQIAEHLLDRGVVRYETGGWILPSENTALDLPRSMADTLRARLERVGEPGLRIARAMALADTPAFSLEECRLLADVDALGPVVDALDRLAVAGVVAGDARGHGLAQPVYGPLLAENLDASSAKGLHASLSRVFDRRPGERFRTARHLLLAGDVSRAIDVMLVHVVDARRSTASNPAEAYDLVDALPSGWRETLRAMVDACEAQGRPRLHRFELLYSLLTYLTTKACLPRGDEHEELLAQLVHAVGLDFFASIDESLPAMERLQIAFGRAQERFDATPEHDRIVPPGEGLMLLSHMIVLIIGLAGRANDRKMLLELPSLEPLAPLSPALTTVEKNRQTTLHLMAGRTLQALRGYLELIERLEQPDRSGLDPSSHSSMHCAMMWAAGLIEASAGIDRALGWADRIDRNPLFEVNAWRLRALHALRQGDAERAEEMTRKLELLRMRNRPPQLFEGTYLWTEALSHAASEDLVRMKHVVIGLEKMAEQFPNWRPSLGFARGQYQRLRGDYAQAERELSHALTLCAPGEHVGWAPIAGAHVGVVLDLGRAQEARELGLARLELADVHGLRALAYNLTQPLALAEAALGLFDDAVAHAEAAIQLHTELGATGVPLGVSHEVRARVALAMGDNAAFAEHAARCAERYRAGRNPVLTAKYERLLRDARRAELAISAALDTAAELTSVDEGKRMATMLATVLGECRGMGERAERALRLLLDETGSCPGGYLYVLEEEGPSLVARAGVVSPPNQMDSAVREFVDAELALEEDATATTAPGEDVTDAGTAWTGVAGDPFVPLVLAHPTDDGQVLTGVVVLAVGDVAKFAPPRALLRAISEALFAAGDALTAVIEA